MTYPPLRHSQRPSCRLRRGAPAWLVLAVSWSLVGCHLVEFSFEHARGSIGRETKRSPDHGGTPNEGTTTPGASGPSLYIPFLDRDGDDATFRGEIPDLILFSEDRIIEWTASGSEAARADDPLWEIGGLRIGLDFENDASRLHDGPR